MIAFYEEMEKPSFWQKHKGKVLGAGALGLGGLAAYHALKNGEGVKGAVNATKNAVEQHGDAGGSTKTAVSNLPQPKINYNIPDKSDRTSSASLRNAVAKAKADASKPEISDDVRQTNAEMDKSNQRQAINARLEQKKSQIDSVVTNHKPPKPEIKSLKDTIQTKVNTVNAEEAEDPKKVLAGNKDQGKMIHRGKVPPKPDREKSQPQPKSVDGYGKI